MFYLFVFSNFLFIFYNISFYFVCICCNNHVHFNFNNMNIYQLYLFCMSLFSLSLIFCCGVPYALVGGPVMCERKHKNLIMKICVEILQQWRALTRSLWEFIWKYSSVCLYVCMRTLLSCFVFFFLSFRLELIFCRIQRIKSGHPIAGTFVSCMLQTDIKTKALR